MDNSNNSSTPRKRGRPATGSKSEVEIRKSIANSEEKNLTQYGGRPESTTLELLKEGISLMDTPPVDMNDFQAVKDRTTTYLQRCYNLGRRPAIAAYALYLGIPRTTLKSYVDGTGKTIDSRSLAMVKYVFGLVDTLYEQQMTDGDMNVVAGIFLMRNNLKYTNVDTVEIVPRQPENNSLNLEDVVAQYRSDDE